MIFRRFVFVAAITQPFHCGLIWSNFAIKKTQHHAEEQRGLLARVTPSQCKKRPQKGVRHPTVAYGRGKRGINQGYGRGFEDQRPNGYRVDRNWTKSGGRLISSGRGVLLVGELAQVPHYPERCRSGWLSPPTLNLRGQAGSTNSRIRILVE